MNINLTANDQYQELVLHYLEENASEALAEKINSGKKTLDNCMDFIAEQVKPRVKRRGNYGYIRVEPEEVFGLAVHFFEEDSIKPEMVREPNLKDPKTGKPVKVGVEKQIEEHKEAAAVKKAKEEAKHGLDGQMDLFSFMEA